MRIKFQPFLYRLGQAGLCCRFQVFLIGFKDFFFLLLQRLCHCQQRLISGLQRKRCHLWAVLFHFFHFTSDIHGFTALLYFFSLT